MNKLVRKVPEAVSVQKLVYSLVCAAVMSSGQAASADVLPAASNVKLQDAGVVALSMPLFATVWVKSSRHAEFTAAVADLYDPASAKFHQWMTEDDIAAFAPTQQEVALATSSLAAQGLHIDKVSPDGSLVKVSGTAGAFQTAFGTTIHKFNASGASLLKTTSTPKFKGANAELVGGVSGLNSGTAKPFLARQIDFSTGLPVPAVAPQAGTNPLAAFTTDCFKSDFSVSMSGYTVGVHSGPVTSVLSGPSYLSTETIIGRPSCGYTVRQLVAHYGLDEVHALGWTGKGETIVIVDAYGSPTIRADANAFSQTMGLPALTEKSLQIVYPDGPPQDVDVGWGGETSLDVEWAHAFAPDAKIVLVIAPTADNAELAYAVEYAVEHRLGSVISNSWGLPEAVADAGTAQMFNHVFKKAAARGIAVNVATGDAGDNGVGTPVGAPNIPADSPYATGIGGTSINIPSDKGPVEAAWGLVGSTLGQFISPARAPVLKGFLQGGGGGESVFLEKPRFQRALPGTGRQLPDISALADPQTGAIMVQTDPSTGTPTYFVTGGTSLATPMFSAIWALANQAAGEPLGQAAPILGQLPNYAIRDVLPIKAKRHTTAATITTRVFSGGVLQPPVVTSYDAAQLLGLDESTDFFSALVLSGLPAFSGFTDLGFGVDSSLKAARGWDNATGYGVPNGLLFVEAVRHYTRHGF